MEQALAYVCCSAEESRVKVQKYCRKIYELGYVPICPRFVFSPFLEESDAEDMQGYGRMSHSLFRQGQGITAEQETCSNKKAEADTGRTLAEKISKMPESISELP